MWMCQCSYKRLLIWHQNKNTHAVCFNKNSWLHWISLPFFSESPLTHAHTRTHTRTHARTLTLKLMHALTLMRTRTRALILLLTHTASQYFVQAEPQPHRHTRHVSYIWIWILKYTSLLVFEEYMFLSGMTGRFHWPREYNWLRICIKKGERKWH